MSKTKKEKLQKKGAIQPNWKESEFAKTMDGQIMIMLEKAVQNGHFIEAQALSWSAVEQLHLPRLIRWIAKELKLALPKEIYKLNAQSVNLVYFCISHDQKLYKRLEENRRQRNKIIHKLALQGDIESINKLAKECTKSHILLQQEIMKRFSGTVLIPAINLYRNGWNDALNTALDKIKTT